MAGYYQQIIKIYDTYEKLRILDSNHSLLDLVSFEKGCKTPNLGDKFHTRYNNYENNLSFLEETSAYISDLEKAINIIEKKRKLK